MVFIQSDIMKYLLLVISSICIFTTKLYSQDNSTSYVDFSFGGSYTGTGDASGFHYGFTFGKALSKKLFWQIGFEGTLHDQPDFLLFYEDAEGNTFDGSLHTVTAGFQVISGLKYNFLQTSNHEFGLALLPMIRYQATSISDIVDTLFPPITDLPFPVRNLIRLNSGRSVSVGISTRIQYRYIFENNLYLGLNGAFQTDTKGDNISSYFLSFGKKF